jgi:hydrogenase maturation protease
MNQWEWHALEDKAPAEPVSISGVELKKGDLVRLNPRKGGDVMDIALAGKVAAIESIEQDYEGKLHVAVVVDDDPGKDLGVLRQPGHRFFFTPEELEPIAPSEGEQSWKRESPRILVAGIGNIFLGDDGFGVEVIRRLSSHTFPENVRVHDFGIRGYDLAYALLDGYDTTILIDAAPRGEEPGTLYVIEPDVSEGDGSTAQESTLDAHAMNPVSVLRLAKSMGEVSGRILLVACEPATLGGEEGQMGLSEAVEAAVDEAVKMIEKLIAELLEDFPKRRSTNGASAHCG